MFRSVTERDGKMKKQKKQKKRMGNVLFTILWTPVLALVLVIAIVGTVLMNLFQTALISYTDLSGDSISVKYADGTEDWESQYYASDLTAQEAMENGFALTERICNDGIILLKNQDASLPLATTGVSLLGRRSVDPVFSGTGAGTVSTTGLVYPKEAFENAGFTVNEAVSNFFAENYEAYLLQGEESAVGNSDYCFTSEIPASDYTFTAEGSDAAIVFIGRSGSESADLLTDLKAYADSETGLAYQAGNTHVAQEAANIVEGQHQLELTAEEKSMVEYAKENYSTVIVVFNSTNPMELGELQNDDGVDAILWIGFPGATGFTSLANIIKGTVNPSGHTTDMFPADLTADPTFVNFGDFTYSDGTNTFVNYAEGIYMGYKYYETAYAEALNGNYPGFDYDEQVVYPFGYGLSYTTFDQKIVSLEQSADGTYEAVVEVTNTGNVAGKDAVELYFTPPYDPAEGIEKADVNLLAFAKTGDIEPGASEQVTLTFAEEDMASYDYKNAGCYVLSGGTYVLSVREDSHTVFDSVEVKVSTAVYDESNPRTSDEVAAVNRFDDVSAMFTDTETSGYVQNMSRSDFAGTFPKAPDAALMDVEREIGGVTLSDALQAFDASAHIDPDAEMPTLNAKNGLQLIDMRGLDYDDPAWEDLLDQLTLTDMEGLAWLGYGNSPMLSIGLPSTSAQDGSAGWHKDSGCCAYSAGAVLGYTWNQELAYEFGATLSEESIANPTLNYAGWYSPAVNIHRSAFGGRVYEYYSSDGVLSGWIAKNCIEGMMKNGVTTYIKHFALNEQETNRRGICTWANEQAIREIYLKPFEIAVKNAETTVSYYPSVDCDGQMETKTIKATIAMMTSYNSIGTTYAGGSYALLTNITRGEWGYHGAIISDGLTGNLSQALLAGEDGNLNLQAMALLGGTGGTLDTKEATYVQAARTAVHNYAYSLVNSSAMNSILPGSTFSYHLAGWKIAIYAVLGVFYALFVLGVVLVVRRDIKYSKQKKAQFVVESAEK